MQLYPSLALVVLALLGISCFSNQTISPPSIAITNVNVIPMQMEEVLYDQTIVITGNMITAVGSSSKITIPEEAIIIDGKDKFLLPGLCDMHIHIDHSDILKVNLAYGVTTVMNYRGLPEHLILKEQSKANQILSPNIYNTGDYMEGYPATFPGFLSFDNNEEAKISVHEQKKAGYDFIKVYRNLDTLMHLAICQAAKENKLTVVGHLSPDIDIEQSFKAGQKVVAHAEEVMYFFNNENKIEQIDELIQLFKKYDVTYTPNLALFESIINQVENLDSITSLSHMQYLHPALFQSWRKENNYNYRRGAKKWTFFMKERNAFLREVTRRMQEGGVNILASTDAPTVAAFPGLAVHEELEAMTEVGFTPYQALRTATVSPGEFISKHTTDTVPFGTIEIGSRADLILLDKNPLTDISNTKSILGVIKNGGWYPQSHLQSELDTLAAHYKKIENAVRSIETAVYDDDISTASKIYYETKASYPSDMYLGYYVMGYGGYRFLYQNRSITTDSIQAQKAIDFYTMYANDYPNMHGSHYLLGLAYLAKRDTTNAIKRFEQSMELHPYNPYAKNRLEQLGIK